MFKVLLYYKFINISDPKAFRDFQHQFCSKFELKGRILISKEGLNGTLAGQPEKVDEYMKATEEYPEIGKIEWKVSEATENPFPKLRVVIRDEIVSFKTKVDLNKSAEYIEPKELKELYENGAEFVILDGRNEYEGRIGKFKNAIVPEIKNFRDFPEWYEKNKELFKNKKIVTYCTGGIRCEKLSAFLIDRGIEDVKQLHGGIHRYSELAGGKNFEGEMYVFDNRINVPVNFVNPEIISECHHCGKKVARYINCCNAKCNKQFICCEECDKKFEGGCCEDCKENSRYKNQ